MGVLVQHRADHAPPRPGPAHRSRDRPLHYRSDRLEDDHTHKLRGVSNPGRFNPFLPKIEEWVERSKGKVRADVVHHKLRPLGWD
ncbi:MAG: hypothetical protein GEV04_16100 [Actinophytocola sp.]|nr:hypothetical protein [Actinophytocola sp.]